MGLSPKEPIGSLFGVCGPGPQFPPPVEEHCELGACAMMLHVGNSEFCLSGGTCEQSPLAESLLNVQPSVIRSLLQMRPTRAGRVTPLYALQATCVLA